MSWRFKLVYLSMSATPTLGLFYRLFCTRKGRLVLFYHSLSEFVLLTKYFKTREKIEGSFNDFRSKQNWNPKADNFFELTNYKQIFLKVRSNYSKILRNYQNFLVNIVFYHIYSQIHHLIFVQFVHYLWWMMVKNHELLFFSFHLV